MALRAAFIQAAGRRGMMFCLCALVLVGMVARPAQAQVKGEIITVGIGGLNGNGGLYREGNWVPVQVRIQNTSGKPFVGHLAVDQGLSDLDGDKTLSIGPEFTLAPGIDARTLWTYYWPRPDFDNMNAADYRAGKYGISKVLVLDKDKNAVATLTLPAETNSAIDIGPEDAIGERRSARYVLTIGRNHAGWKSLERMYGGTEAIQTASVTSPGQLPDRALGYDGVDVIFWQTQSVKLSDMAPAEFTLAPILDWVKSGGHLIISVSAPDQVQAFSHGNEQAQALLPMSLSGTRDIKTSDLTGMYFWGPNLNNDPPANLVQAIGTVKPGARVVVGDAPSSNPDEKKFFSDAPLAVTHLFGQGAVTLLTVDPCDQEIMRHMDDKQFIYFWNQVAGWRQNQFRQNVYSATEFQHFPEKEQTKRVSFSPTPILLGGEIDRNVDVSDVTAVRILVALLFLGVYWLLAGPVGHLILRAYKVVHWSWWIFGGTVIVATGVAGVVVLLLHVTSYEVRHESFILGTVTPGGQAQSDSTVVGFYGIYSPSSGLTPISLPESQGLAYLTPLCLPTNKEVKGFADPQSYNIQADRPTTVSPVFRNTLKKLQGRWHGQIPGVSGSAAYTAAPTTGHLIDGKLTNNSGYDLKDVEVLVFVPHVTRVWDIQPENDGSTYRFRLKGGSWGNGQAIDLQLQLELDDLEFSTKDLIPRIGTMEMALQAAGWKLAAYQHGGFGGGPYAGLGNALPSDERQLISLFNRDWRFDHLYLLGDLRNNDDLSNEYRRSMVRGIGRLTDCTKALRAAGALIIAHSDDVKSPIPVTVNGHVVAGKGSVTCAWALPLGGTPPDKRIEKLVPATSSKPAGTSPLIPDVKPEGT